MQISDPADGSGVQRHPGAVLGGAQPGGQAGLVEGSPEVVAALGEVGPAVVVGGHHDRSTQDGGRGGGADAESDLREHLDAARDGQDRLSLVLAADPAERPVGWPLRGELVSHIDRLRHQLEPGGAIRSRPEGVRSWWVPPLVSRLQQRLPTQSRK
jgi:hypothetical protein